MSRFLKPVESAVQVFYSNILVTPVCLCRYNFFVMELTVFTLAVSYSAILRHLLFPGINYFLFTCCFLVRTFRDHSLHRFTIFSFTSFVSSFLTVLWINRIWLFIFVNFTLFSCLHLYCPFDCMIFHSVFHNLQSEVNICEDILIFSLFYFLKVVHSPLYICLSVLVLVTC